MRPLCLLAFCTLVPAASLAQTSAVAHQDLSRGVTLPPTSAALASQSTAVSVNPAGLTYLGGLELFYAHERAVNRLETGDGLYLGTTLFGALGAGASVEWLRGAPPSRRKTTWALSMGGQAFSAGGSYSLFSAPDAPELALLRSWTAGLEGRPSQYLAYGLTVRNLDEPGRGALTLPRTWDLALASRPVGDNYSVGVDYLFQDSLGLTSGRLSYTVLAQILPGLTLGGGVSHGLRSGDELLLQLSLTVDTAHFGATYAVGGASGGLDHVVAVRLSQKPYRSVLAGAGEVALFDVDQQLALTASPALGLLGIAAADPYLSFVKLLDGAIRDPGLKGVVLKVNSAGLGLGRAEELRRAVLRLRASGKTVMAVLLNVEDADYLYASAADRIYAVPEAAVLVDGFQATPLFLGGTMEKLGVRWEVARVGAFKNAPDQLTRTQMSPEQRAAIEAYLDADVKAFREAVTAARPLSADKLAAAIDEGLKTPRRAVELGLVDEVITPADLDRKVAELVPRARFNPEYRPRSVRDDRWGIRPKVAIIPVLGNIVGGRSQSGGLTRTAGAETLMRALRSASEDPGVAAIVLRVDSGGGDGLASDLIYRAVLEAKKKKPVVASMGEVAASGGYYVAMGADEIWAEPTTLTGSIGVFLMRPALEGLAEKVGARQEAIRRGKLAGLMDLYSPWTDAERESAQRWVEAFYDDFISEVAKSRGLPKERVDALARGRVWSGADAKANGLVSELGGLLEAVESARRQAGLRPDGEADLEIVTEGGGLLGALGAESSVVARLFPATPVQQPFPEGLMQLARQLGVDQALTLRPGVMAMMEFGLTVR